MLRFHDFLESSIKCILDNIPAPKVVIEIGVFEGYFTFNMTEMIAVKNKDYIHYAIDPYEGASDVLTKNRIIEAEKSFHSFYSNFKYKDHIKPMKKNSWEGLMDLYNAGIKADLIYVDGDHRASTVLNDMVLGFKLLNVGGAMLCDDSVSWCYTEKNGVKPLDYSPRLAVDAFIHCNWGIVDPLILPNGYQTAFIKRGEKVLYGKDYD